MTTSSTSPTGRTGPISGTSGASSTSPTSGASGTSGTSSTPTGGTSPTSTTSRTDPAGPATAAGPAAAGTTRLRVDVWADVVCPWCYVGAARLTRAIDDAGLTDRVDLVPRAFELDPTTPDEPAPVLDHLAHKFGGLLADSSAMADQVRTMEERVRDLAVAEGLPFEVDRVTANTRDAHRVTALARERGLGVAFFDALQRAYFAGASDDPFGRATLLAVAGEVGLPAADVERVLDSDAYADEVRHDQAEAAAIGVQGVPFVVVGGRYGVSGAREVEVYREVLRAALAEQG